MKRRRGSDKTSPKRKRNAHFRRKQRDHQITASKARATLARIDKADGYDQDAVAAVTNADAERAASDG